MAATTPTASLVTGRVRLQRVRRARSTPDLTTRPHLVVTLRARSSKTVFDDRRKSHNPPARTAQRRVGRHRLPGPQRLRRRASRHARAHHAPRAASSTTRRPPPPAPSSPSARTSSACSWRPARATPTSSTRSSTRCSVGLKQRVGAGGFDLLLFASRAPRQRLRRALLPQARPPPQRRRLSRSSARSRRRRGAPARARGAPLRRRRRRSSTARAPSS